MNRNNAIAMSLATALLLWVGPSNAIDYVTPLCGSTPACVQTSPLKPNDVDETFAYFAVWSGLRSTARTPNLQVMRAGNAITVTGVYVQCDDCFDVGHPPPVAVSVPLGHLAAGHYSIQLFLSADPSYPDPPPVITAGGTVMAGITIVGEFDVAHGRDDTIVGVVEYYYPPFDHYFLTSSAAEMAFLDARQPPFQDWERTGEGFNAFVPSAAPFNAKVCRFFNDAYAPKSSHFYAAQGLGCEQTIESFPDWKLETDDAFRVTLPASFDGSCGDLTYFSPVYRLYNNGKGGAPNHRYTTSLETRQDMIEQGWVPEGFGIGVAFCAPK